MLWIPKPYSPTDCKPISSFFRINPKIMKSSFLAIIFLMRLHGLVILLMPNIICSSIDASNLHEYNMPGSQIHSSKHNNTLRDWISISFVNWSLGYRASQRINRSFTEINDSLRVKSNHRYTPTKNLEWNVSITGGNCLDRYAIYLFDCGFTINTPWPSKVTLTATSIIIKKERDDCETFSKSHHPSEVTTEKKIKNKREKQSHRQRRRPNSWRKK